MVGVDVFPELAELGSALPDSLLNEIVPITCLTLARGSLQAIAIGRIPVRLRHPRRRAADAAGGGEDPPAQRARRDDGAGPRDPATCARSDASRNPLQGTSASEAWGLATSAASTARESGERSVLRFHARLLAPPITPLSYIVPCCHLL
eukprot:gene13449-biopygen6547